jgi:hypothetical protein
MSDWRTRLKDADAAWQKDMSAEEIQKTRNVVLAAARQLAPGSIVWRRPVVIAYAVLVIVVGGATAVLHTTLHTNQASLPEEHRGAAGRIEEPNTASDRQQLQFATPGGTRIIWVFDPNFEVKGTVP